MPFVDTILKPFVAQCICSASCNAFVLGEKEYTFADLAKGIAHHIRAFRLLEGQYVGIYVNEELPSYCAIWAAWFCGKTAVPIVHDALQEREALILSDCSPIDVIMPDADVVIDSFEDAIDLMTTCLTAWGTDAQELIVLYTSGSTGTPKGAPLSGMNLAAFYEAFRKTPYDWHAGDRCLQLFDLSFDFSMLVYLPMWLAGGCIYGIPKGEMLTTYIYYLLTEKKLTILPIVPTLLNYLKPYFEELDCSDLRQLMVSGEPVPVSLVREWYERVPHGIIHTPYGPTECCMLSTTFSYPRDWVDERMGQWVSIGYLFSGMKGMVLNEAGEQVAFDTPGELYLNGPQVSSGYINRDALNKEKFVYLMHEGEQQRFYRTGDWVIPRSDGRFDFVGRIDHQVTLKGGFRVELGEIETVVERLVPQCANRVVTIQNRIGNIEAVLIFESVPFDTESFKQQLQQALPWYMQPYAIYFLANFPLNQNKKTSRPAMQLWAQQQYDLA